eukprot:gene6293-7458_t
MALELPISAHREQILSVVEQNRCLVLLGETGSGKTTQLPQYILDAGLLNDKPIVVTQPRRVAAISVAERVSQERGNRVGDEVGYHVRFDKCCSEKTRIKYVTDGVLLRECLESPNLEQYGVVILDEAHIRSLETDILSGLLKRNIVEKSTGPKLIIMSATLQAERLKEFFGCNQYIVPGRLYPIKIKHCGLITPENNSNYVQHCVDVALQIHKHKPPGDILIFLTGRSEIDTVCEMIFSEAEDIDYSEEVEDKRVEGVMVVPVYGSMTSRAQKRIFTPPPAGIRKVVVATEIASTSLTVDGIVYVIDSGYVKQTMYNARTGLDSLKIMPISRSEAQQRAGRAGRTQPGECYRLYDISFEEKLMPEYTVPEIQRTSLTAVILTLKCLGIHDVLHFDYLDAPEEFHILEALRQLFFFDAIDTEGNVTVMGHLMASFPLPPSLARVLLHARIVEMPCGYVDDLIALIAMLSSEYPFVRPSRPKAQERAESFKDEILACTGDDFMALLYLYRLAERQRDLKDWCSRNYIHFRVMNSATRIKEQLDSILSQLPVRDITLAGGIVADRLLEREAANTEKREKSEPGKWHQTRTIGSIDHHTQRTLRRALCFGLFTNIARRSEEHSYFRTVEGNASVVLLHPSSCFFEHAKDLDWVIFHRVVWTAKPYMHTIAPVKYEWVKRLLPKLRKVEVRQLTTTGQLSKAAALEVSLETRKAKQALSAEDFGKRRNDDDSVQSARERYMERKKSKRAAPI